MTFNVCITVVMNSLTHFVSQGSVMTFIRRVDNFVTILLQIHSGICAPKVIETEPDLTKVLRK